MNFKIQKINEESLKITEKNNYSNYRDKNNEILIIVEIQKKDINKNIYFLDNTDYFDEEKKINYFHDNLPELNKSNVELFINNEKYEFQKYFIPNKEGFYTIKLKINIYIKNCSHMFNECNNLINIDLSSFNTEYVTDMSYMFAYCYKLKNINLSSLNTKNVTDMSYMFAYCHNLSNIDLSNFDTKNVNNMYSMFSYCYILKNINLASFETTNVTNMGYMFSNCESLINLDLSYFNIQNVIDMSYMFSSCYKLKYIDLSNFILNDKANVKINVNGMFFPCSNLEKIKMKNNFYEIIKTQISSNIEIIMNKS